jgi:AcrR family transcriptional regulator
LKTKAKETPVPANDEQRRATILTASLDCFLKFGYAKTSLDDIAKSANLSRPLLYLKFRNKEEIFKGVFDHLVGGGYDMAKKLIAARGEKLATLMEVYEWVLLKPWERVMGQAMSAEFYDTCRRLFPDVCSQHDKMLSRYVTTILGNKEQADVFILAAWGLLADLPPPKVLRRRLAVLSERFIQSPSESMVNE